VFAEDVVPGGGRLVGWRVEESVKVGRVLVLVLEREGGRGTNHSVSSDVVLRLVRVQRNVDRR